MPSFPSKEKSYTLLAVRSACESAARLGIYKMGRGIRSLNAIAITAPMLGATALLDASRPVINLAWYPTVGCVSGGWSEIFVPFAISIATASVATAFHGILSARIESFRTETETTILQLLNGLGRPPTHI